MTSSMRIRSPEGSRPNSNLVSARMMPRAESLEIGLAQSQNALSTLLGKPTGSLQNLLQGPETIPVAPPQVAVSIPADMLSRRPDIRSAELIAVAQSERIGIAKTDLYPHFVLAGALGVHSTEPDSAAMIARPRRSQS